MSRIPGKILWSIIVTGFLAGCAGTTHHFLPPRPLEAHEVMISWTWNYDLDGWNIPTMSPALNFYAGLGNNDNVGIGVQYIGITHLTYAKYYDVNGSAINFLYVHQNQPLGTMHNNPYFEIGFGRASQSGGIAHMVSGGLSLGHGMSYGLLAFLPRDVSQREDTRDFTRIWRLMPAIKYAAMGRDISASLSYYYGKSKLIHDNIVNAFTHYNDTILYLPAEMIDSIGSSGGVIHPMYAGPAIYLKGDSVVYLWSEWHDSYDPDLFTTWGPFVGSINHVSKFYIVGHGRFFGNLKDIRDAVDGGKDVVITKYPSNYLGELRNPKGLWRDFGVGFAAMQIRWSDGSGK